MLEKSGQTFWDKIMWTFKSVASGVLKSLPTAGWRYHRKPGWCRNQNLLPAYALQFKFRLTVCRVVVADSRQIAHPGCAEKKGSGRWTCDTAWVHLFRWVYMCCVFMLYKKRPIARLLAVVHWRSPQKGHMMRDIGGFHWRKLQYQQPLWSPVLNCDPGNNSIL